jgi:hypothetical protein
MGGGEGIVDARVGASGARLPPALEARHPRPASRVRSTPYGPEKLAPDAIAFAPDEIVLAAGEIAVAADAIAVAAETIVLSHAATVVAPDAIVVAPDAIALAPDAITLAPDAIVLAPDAIVVGNGSFCGQTDCGVPCWKSAGSISFRVADVTAEA